MTPEQLIVGDIAASTSVDQHDERPKTTCRTLQGAFVPLELWTPPTLSGKPRLKGLVGLGPYPKFKSEYSKLKYCLGRLTKVD
jgi:hypothetical protein